MIDVERIYRYLDTLNSKYKERIQQISFEHTLNILGNQMSVVFYDVTTLYFKIEDEDDLLKTGFSKEGKHQHPQIVLGLLVSIDGYPLAYEISTVGSLKVIPCCLSLKLSERSTSSRN